jgi:predicted extracellular nuclease
MEGVLIVTSIGLRRLAAVALTLVVVLTLAAGAAATTAPQSLPFTQNWSSTGLIAVSDDWSGVPGVVGYRGDGLVASTGVDPQTILADGTAVIDVNANQSSPNTFATGGVAEFEIADPVVALQGSGTADAPHVVAHVNTTGAGSATVSYNLRDIDGSADNAVQPIALQYRVGTSGTFTNLPAGFVADATTGPSLATLVTPVSVSLPAAAIGQPHVEIRIITSDAAGSDEWVGIDDISIAEASNAPVVATCGAPLNTVQGTAATRQVSASDADGRVTGLAITSVTPSPAAGTISLADVVPAAAVGGTATGDVTVSAGVPAGTYSVLMTATNDDSTAQTGTCTLSVTVDPPVVPIYTLQGSGSTSPFANSQQTTTGVVTVVLGGGFFIQDPTGDGSSATSDGIFAFTGNATARTVAPGDVVRVTGTLIEFRQSTRPRDLTLTEFSPTSSVTKISTAPLPAPVTITNRPDTVIDPEGILTFEQLEGMRVSIATPRVSGPTNDFGELVVAASGDHANMTPGGNFLLHPLAGGAVDYNPERIMVDDEARAPGGTGSGTRINNPMVPLTNGDTATGNIVGALDYQFSNYRVQASHLVSSVIAGSPPAFPAANLRDAATFEGRIASFNVENLFDCADDPNHPNGGVETHPTCTSAEVAAVETQLAKLAAGFESELEKPDIVIVEETENVEVLVGDASGNVPGTTLTPLLDRVSGSWDAVSFDASDERGIQVAFAFNTDRVTLHDAFLSTDVLPDGGLFSGSATIRAGREPLVGIFSIDDLDDIVVVGNHFKSKGGPQFGVDPLEAGDDPLYGAFQPPARWTELQTRHAQADYVRDLVDLLLSQDSERRIVVGGDLNDFEFGEPGEGMHTVQRIVESDTAPLTNVVPLVPAAERYTFVFEGNSQVLDHLLLNREMESLRRGQAIAHFNADYPSAFGSNAAHPLRSSDHDPLVAYFCTDLTPCTRAQIEELIDDLEALLAADPRKKLEDKIEDVIANLRQALRKLGNDRQGAAGELEGAAGDLEATVKSKLLGASQGNAFLERIAGAARLLAVEAIEEAEDVGGDAAKIADAKDALAKGDERVDAKRFKDAVAKYKDALSKAEGA